MLRLPMCLRAAVLISVCSQAVAFVATPAFVIPKSPAQPSALLAHKSRRVFIKNATRCIAPSLVFLQFASSAPLPANASYGAGTNIQLPNYVEFLIEKNKQVDPASMLYNGPDSEVLLRRIGEAGARLPEVAMLAEEKKWSQVQGIITGPMGTLLQTLNQVASVAGTKAAKDAAKDVKADLFQISAAATKKETSGCVKFTAKASTDLEKFVRIAFST